VSEVRLPKFHPQYRAGQCKAPLEEWRVTTYKGNHSAFNGNRFQSSDYSAIQCRRCRHSWRTNAKYVYKLLHGDLI
jgi:hypothetical protein